MTTKAKGFWSEAGLVFESLLEHEDGCEHCKQRRSYHVGRCDKGDSLHSSFEENVDKARNATVDKRKKKIDKTE